ncbi:hypothetical protein ACWEQ2_40825 [Streptomyces sp. NPDC004096]
MFELGIGIAVGAVGLKAAQKLKAKIKRRLYEEVESILEEKDGQPQ